MKPGLIIIKNGTTDITVKDETMAFSEKPNIHGDKTLVYVNGKLIYGKDEDDRDRYGCNAGFGVFGALVMLGVSLLSVLSKRRI